MGGIIGELELRGCVQAPAEGSHCLGWAHDRRIGVLQHEHGQIVRIGVGDVEMLLAHGHGGREPARIDFPDEVLRNVLGTQTRSHRIKAKTRDRRLRHAGCGA